MKWALRHKEMTHTEGNSGSINVRFHLPNLYRQAEDITADLNSKSTNLGATPSTALTQLLHEMMCDERGTFSDSQTLTQENLARVQRTLYPVSIRSDGTPKYPKMHAVRVMADRRIARHKAKHEKEEEDAVLKNTSTTKTIAQPKTPSTARTSSSTTKKSFKVKAPSTVKASSTIAKTPGTAKTPGIAKTPRQSVTRPGSTVPPSTTRTQPTPRPQSNVPPSTTRPQLAVPPAFTDPTFSRAAAPSTSLPTNLLTAAQQRAARELDRAISTELSARLSSARNRVVYYICQYTMQHSRTIMAEKVMDATKRIVHDERGALISRQYTKVELTGLALDHGGSSSAYAIRQMQSWIETHRGFHERANAEPAQAKVEHEYLMEVDKGEEGEEEEQD